MRRLAILLTCLLGASGALGQSYLIQPGDRLEISVLEDPGLGRTVLVRPDGRISLPLAGSLDVGGRTPEDVERVIRSRLARDFVSPPTVTVGLAQLGAPTEAEEGLASIYVIGQVQGPGRYEVPLPADVLQVLATAGGPGVFAARQRIQVRRRTADGEAVLLFDYDGVEEGRVPSNAIALKDGDVIVVPERGLFE